MKRKAPAKRPTRTAKAPKRDITELARLDPLAFHRAMLEDVLQDVAAARAKGSMTAVHQGMSTAIRLRRELAVAEEELRATSSKMKAAEELVQGVVEAIAKMPDGVFERVAAAVDQRRTGRPRMRVVG